MTPTVVLLRRAVRAATTIFLRTKKLQKCMLVRERFIAWLEKKRPKSLTPAGE